MIQEYHGGNVSVAPVDYAFQILGNVSQQGYTKWSIVYDIVNKRISFRTAGFPEIKFMSFESLDFGCNTGAKVLEMNQHIKGDVASHFIPYNESFNRKVVEKSVKESKPQIDISRKSFEAHLALTSTFSCKN